MNLKTIGLIGGMSWESTVTYYKIINETVKERLGGLHSAKCILYSVDFQEIEECQANGNWEKSGEILGEAANNLEKAGADFIVICTNTMHKVVNQIKEKISIPILHIAEMTAEKILEKELLKKYGLKVKKMISFSRPTLLPTGIKGWLQTFSAPALINVPVEMHEKLIDEITEKVEKELERNENGQILADYIRLRFEAVKE